MAIGTRTPRLDGIKLVTGEAKYTGDLAFAHVLHGELLTSPLPHARIRGVDTSRALRLPGVKAVVTAADTPGIKYGSGVQDQPVFAGDRVRHVGDPIAAVAAVDRETALQALDLIGVDFEELPALFDPIEAMSPDATLIHELASNVMGYAIVHGDVERALAEADLVFEHTFQTSPVQHCCLEPHACVANADGMGKITLWTSSSTPFALARNLSRVLDIPLSKVRVIKPHVGGGFGIKGELMAFHYAAALLSRKARRPVRMISSREQQFTSTRVRHPMTIHLRTGVNRDGTLVARDAKVVVNSGAYSAYGPAVTYLAGACLASLYHWPNFRYNASLVYTNTPPGGALRGFGNPQTTFAGECQIDIIARELSMDPVELRLKNAVQPGDTTACGWRITSCGLQECLEKARAQMRAWRSDDPDRGLGLACMIHCVGLRFGPTDSSSAEVKFRDDGSVLLSTGAAEVGQGSDTVLAQIAAATLGVNIGAVEVVAVDTDIVPPDLGTFASKTTFIAGNAVRIAAEDARRQVFEVVARRLEASPDDLVAEQGTIFVRGSPDRRLAFAEAVRLSQWVKGQPIVGKGSFDAPSENYNPRTLYGNIAATYAFAAQVASVQVDRETGRVEVADVAGFYDAGRAINPLAVEGQADGAVAMGIGYALSEEVAYDAKGGVASDSFRDYHLPTAFDAPRHSTQMVETEDPIGPFGAKGMGESAIVPVAAAVANAVHDAVGVRMTELPITPERVLSAMKSAGRSGGASVHISSQESV